VGYQEGLDSKALSNNRFIHASNLSSLRVRLPQKTSTEII
jgi:hypothetical protein